MHGSLSQAEASQLFAPFDAYCAANPTLPPATAARARIDAVWAMWTALPPVAPGVPQLVGYYIDTHIPLIQTDPAPHTTQLVYKAGLNPEMQNLFPCTLRMMPEAISPREAEFCTLVHAACPSPSDAPAGATPILKLIRKAFPNQLSVRYIRPQFQRCNTTTASRALAIYIYRLSLLGAYSHSRTIADVPARIRLYSTRSEAIFEAVARVTSRALYAMVAEPIAAVFRTDVALMLRAESHLGGVQTYIDALTGPTATAPPLLEAPPARAKSRARITPRYLITQIPLAAAVATAQAATELAATGLAARTAFCCRMCGILHARSDKSVPRTTKKHLGVAIDLASDCLGTPQCNNCGLSTFVERLTLTGYLTTACMSATRRELLPIVTCGACSRITTKPEWHKQTPLCQACFGTTMRAQTAAIACVCGGDRTKRARLFTAANETNEPTMYGACQAHQFDLPTATTCPLTPVAVYRTFIANTPRKRKKTWGFKT